MRRLEARAARRRRVNREVRFRRDRGDLGWAGPAPCGVDHSATDSARRTQPELPNRLGLSRRLHAQHHAVHRCSRVGRCGPGVISNEREVSLSCRVHRQHQRQDRLLQLYDVTTAAPVPGSTACTTSSVSGQRLISPALSMPAGGDRSAGVAIRHAARRWHNHRDGQQDSRATGKRTRWSGGSDTDPDTRAAGPRRRSPLDAAESRRIRSDRAPKRRRRSRTRST